MKENIEKWSKKTESKNDLLKRKLRAKESPPNKNKKTKTNTIQIYLKVKKLLGWFLLFGWKIINTSKINGIKINKVGNK